MEDKTPDQQIKDWSISKLYEQSWEIVKKNKVIWLFGIAASSLSASASNFPSSNFESKDLQNLQKFFQQNPESTSQVLSTTTTNVTNLFSLIPIYIYVLLALEIITLVVIFWTVSIISQAWTTASLIHSIQTAINNQQSPNIRDTSEKAFANIKSVAWLNIIPWLILLLSSAAIFTSLGISISLTGPVAKILLIILLVLAIIIFLYALIFLMFSEIWALRKVVLEDKPPGKSLSEGYKIAKKKFWAMSLLGLVNAILSSIIVGVPLALMIGLFLGGVHNLGSNKNLGVSLIVSGGILLFVFILTSQLLAGILTAFKASVWTIAYNNTKGKYEQ